MATSHASLTAIPVVAQQTIALFALWDAALAIAGNGSVYVHESDLPGAADALRAWADAHGFAAEDRVHVTDHSAPYVTLHVNARGCSLAALAYRAATLEESGREAARITSRATGTVRP